MPVYGVNLKDPEDAALGFLSEHGDLFRAIWRPIRAAHRHRLGCDRAAGNLHHRRQGASFTAMLAPRARGLYQPLPARTGKGPRRCPVTASARVFLAGAGCRRRMDIWKDALPCPGPGLTRLSKGSAGGGYENEGLQEVRHVAEPTTIAPATRASWRSPFTRAAPQRSRASRMW